VKIFVFSALSLIMDPSQDPLDSLYSYLIDPDSCWQGPYEALTVQDTDTFDDQSFSPFAFETEFDPAVHRPHINVSEYIETADQDIAASSVYRTALNESSNISTVQDVDAISFTPSTPLTPPYDAWTDWLEAPAADLSANTPPYSPIADPPKDQNSYASLVQNTSTAVAISSKWNSSTLSGIKLTVLEQAYQSKTQ
jgi:hypothetical protein